MPSNTKWRKDQWKHLMIVIVLLTSLATGVYFYAKHREVSGLLPVTFESSNGAVVTEKIHVEIVSTPAERKKGLMYRKDGELAPDRGMLFIFPQETVQSFWMKNTYLSLDMIFINSKNEVVGIVDNVPPLNTVSRKVDKPSTYVIEVLAGISEKLGVKPGMKVKFHGPIPKPV